MKPLSAIIATLIIPVLLLHVGCGTESESEDVISVEISTHWIPVTTSEVREINAIAYGDSGPTDADFEWSSSNPSVATVSGGNIYPSSPGTTIVAATADGFTTDPCTVHVAEDWIIYAGNSGLRIISPDNNRDMPIKGTSEAAGPILWTNTGIYYNTPALWGYSYLWFRAFNSDSAWMVTADTLDEIHDIRLNPDGGYFVASYPNIYALDANRGLPGIADYLYIHDDSVYYEDMDISPNNDGFVARVSRMGYSTRLLIFDMDGNPEDTIALVGVNCPRFNPTGTKVAYGYSARIYIADLTTNPISIGYYISEGEGIRGLSWSGDGGEIAMCVLNSVSDYELWIGNPGTGETNRLTNAQSSSEYYFPQWID